MLNVHIQDPSTGFITETHTPEGEKTGLVVYNEPLINFTNSTIFFNNKTYGSNLNQNLSPSGAIEQVYKGVSDGGTDWTSSAIRGTWDFASTTQAQGGTESVDGTLTVNNDEMLLDKGSTITLSSFSSLTGHIYIEEWLTTGTKQILLKPQLNGASVGSDLDIKDYINIGDLNVWQKFSIPNTDFNFTSTTLDELAIVAVDTGPGNSPNFFLDTIQWESSAGNDPDTFSILPENNERAFITIFSFFMSSNININLIGDSEKFAGLDKLTNGLVIRRRDMDSTESQTNVKSLSSLICLPNAEFNTGGTTTSSWVQISYKFDTPLSFFDVRNDSISISISDDLSSLTKFTVSANKIVR